MDFYISKQEFFEHATTMQKAGRNDVAEWFERFDCPIQERTIEEMMHLMAQLRDGAISYNMLFQEPKHPKQK